MNLKTKKKEERMKFRDKMQEIVSSTKAKEVRIFSEAVRNSAAYAEVLNLETEALDVLSRNQPKTSMCPDLQETAKKGFLKITAWEERFSLTIKHVCGSPYGDGWQNLILAICSSDDSLNHSVGHGTTLVTSLDEEWHGRVVEYLRTTEVSG